MTHLLDTNVCVDFLTGRYPSVVQRIQQSPPENLRISSVVLAELRSGAEKSSRRRENHARLDTFMREVHCLDFDSKAALTFGRIRRELESRGTPIGPYDMLIAAHALSLGLVLVTDNVREFRRVGSLEVENWRE